MKKPRYREKSRQQIQRRVNAIRLLMRIGARQMVDLTDTIGRPVVYDTGSSAVRALAYGFDDPQVRPLLINMHGSGFVLGSAAMDDPFMTQFVENCGVKVLSIDYPLSPDVMFPTALNQCRDLVHYAAEHAEELGIDGERIMLMGHSAGGNFAAAIGLLENDRPVPWLKGIILDYPPTDLSKDPYDKPMPKGCLPPALCRLFDAAYCTKQERLNPLVSPALASADMVSHFPPVLVITAGQDSLAEETERFKDTLIEAGVDVTFRRFEGAIHGFTIMTEKDGRKRPELYRQSLEAWKMMMDFVKEKI